MSSNHYYYMDEHGYVSRHRHGPNDAPVVVISPEDREQVERLVRDNYDRIHRPGAFDDLSSMSRVVFVDFMQAALREFANPTPPKCGAHVNIAGRDFQCVEPTKHGGGHRNPDAEAVWGEGE